MNLVNEKIPKVWLTRAGKYGSDEATALDRGLAIIGFKEIPDLSASLTSENVLELVRNASPGAPEQRIRNHASQVGAFALSMKEGDIVVLPLKTASKTVALGRVSGPYNYREIDGEMRHTRLVNWIRSDIPRTEFHQDLLYSMGAFMTVCRIQRNDAERRIAAILSGQHDPGLAEELTTSSMVETTDENAPVDIAGIAHDQIVAYLQTRFQGHDLARLVDAVLCAEGYQTELSPLGPDGGVDILAGRGILGLDTGSLCVQVKATSSPADVTIFRALQGTMQTFKAERGLLVSWSGFTKALRQEARQSFFQIRLWDASDLIQAVCRIYEKLPEEIQAELPLKRIWTLVIEEEE